MSPFDAPALRVRFYVGTDMIGGGKVAFLRLLSDHGSVSAAAEAMGVTETRALFFLDTLQACFREPLWTGTGDTRDVTPTGQALIAKFAETEAALRAEAGPFLAWLSAEQPERG